jgi:hypothetical protein
MSKEIENIKNYFVYQYQYLDDLRAVLNPQDTVLFDYLLDEYEKAQVIAMTINEVAKLFRKNGWEGDGTIGIIWIPPFVDIGFEEDTCGAYLWHVKQSNNGVSYIASSFQINSDRL